MFSKHFASKSQPSGLSVNRALVENELKNIYLEADLELTYHVDLKWGRRKARFATIIVVFKHKFQHLEEYLEKLVAMLLFLHSQTVQL